MVKRTICAVLKKLSLRSARVEVLWVLACVQALVTGHAWAAQEEPRVPGLQVKGDTPSQGLNFSPSQLAPSVGADVPLEAETSDAEGSVLEGGSKEPLAAETGIASWYGPGFHRRRTASGERFDMHALTAAHRTLPFGTLVCVRSQATGREVVVRINDRGPHVANRVMDLSRGAALALGMHGLGLKPVDVFPLSGDDTTCPPKRAD